MTEIFARIVVPTDFSPCSKQAWQLAPRLAMALGSELILAHVFVEETPWSESPFNMERMRELFADGRRRAGETLDEWATPARVAGLTGRLGNDRGRRPAHASRARRRVRRLAGRHLERPARHAGRDVRHRHCAGADRRLAAIGGPGACPNRGRPGHLTFRRH